MWKSWQSALMFRSPNFLHFKGKIMSNTFDIFKEKFEEIKQMGWIENYRKGNDGGPGNTLEDLLEVAENNLQLPDLGEWELKSHRRTSSSLLTLFHTEPSPRIAKIVPTILLPQYGWKHQKAGSEYPETERSFRATLNNTYSDRGLRVAIDYVEKQVYIDFNANFISDRHIEWKTNLAKTVGLNNFAIRPYWSFEVINKILQTKIANLLYFDVESKKENGVEYFKYQDFEAYMRPTLERFLKLVEEGCIYIDFDARTGHNHGTKIRIKPNRKHDLYDVHIET